ncbi:MAG: hypothetical protein L6308_07085 [Candidatus Omnitrophica bacterium]|nr:hypothetical protein [Candidatus Omnitrophota bacterium]
MKRPISLWVFGIGGVITNILGGIILFLMLYMPIGAFFMIQFLATTCLLILLLIISTIALFKLKKWGRNIFIVFTLILNIILIWYLLYFSLLTIAVIIFLICFVVYFFKPSTRALFNK